MLTLGSSTQRAAGFTASAPSRPAIAFHEAIREAAPLFVVEAPASFGPQPFSFRDPARSALWRFFAHVLVRLLVLAPLPPQLQAAAVLFPVSILWPLVRPAEASAGDSRESGSREGAEPATSPLSEGKASTCGKVPDPFRAQRIVNLTEPTQPKIAGYIRPTEENPVGMGGRLALGKDNILYSTTRSVFGGAGDPLGGVRSAALATIAIIKHMTPSPIVVENDQDVTEKAVRIDAGVVPGGYEIKTAEVELYKDGVLFATLPAEPSGAAVTATWPAKQPVDRKATYTARAIIDRDEPRPLRSAHKDVPLVEIVFVDKEGEETFAPPTSDPRPVVTLDPVTLPKVALMAGGTQAQVQISGEVKDGLADIVPEKAADITQVSVGGQTLSVTRLPDTEERPTDTRPYAFRGKFSGTVTVDIGDGANTVAVEAENTVGNRGYDSFTINVQRTQDPLPQVVPTGNYHAPKFLDPFTLVTGLMRPDLPDQVVLYHGATVPTGSETPLVETGPSTLDFRGTTPELGEATLVFEAPLAAMDPMARDTVRGTLSSDGLGITDDALELVETTANSGIFRNAALRLPTNEPMEISLDQALSPSSVDGLHVKAGLDPQAQPATLTETGPDSRVFAGYLSGAEASIEVYVFDTPGGQPGTMRIFLDSIGLSLSGYYLELHETAAASLRFKTEIDGPTSIEVTLPASIPQTTLVGVENHEGTSAGSFKPVWVVAKGLRSYQVGDVAQLEGVDLELTLDTPPRPSTPPPTPPKQNVRIKRPVAFVRDAGASHAPTVKQGPEDPSVSDPNQLHPRRYEFWFKIDSGDLQLRRETGAAVLSQAVGIRGTSMVLTTRFVAGSRADVRSIVIEGGDVRVDKTTTRLVGCSKGSCEIEATSSISVDANAPVGARDMEFRFKQGDPKTFKKAFQVTRGRVVIFAIDGLRWSQLDNVKDDPRPALDQTVGKENSGTALARIFGDTFKGPAAQRRRDQVTATFPPITLSRWATVFSGSPPKDTLAVGFRWFNRQAEITHDTGRPDMGLGMWDSTVARNAMVGGDYYNRHFKVPFVYDTLRARGLRSVVVMQQAGLGMACTGLCNRVGDDIWEKGEVSKIWAMSSSDTLTSGRAMDASAFNLARDVIQRGDDFDLLVVYLAGLDHYLHGVGVSDGRGEGFFRQGGEESLHGTINRLYRLLKERFGPTIAYGLFADHGLVDTDPEKYMDLVARGEYVDHNGFPTWIWALGANPLFRVGTFVPAGLAGESAPPNVIFVPDGGYANVYVASDAARGGANWTAPPPLATIEQMVKNINQSYVNRDRPAVTAVTDMLVRVPDPANPGSFGASQYKVVPRLYDYKRPLAEQLEDLSELANRPWGYADPKARLEQWISANTGDIVLFANTGDGFYFSEKGLRGNHGSLTADDANIPLAWGYPSATDQDSAKDTMLKPVLEFLNGRPSTAMSEADSIRRFFLAR